MTSESVSKRFSSVIRTIIENRGISQLTLGEKYLEVSQSCVRDYLNGKVHPLSVKTGTMQRIAGLYGVSVDALLHYLLEGSWKQGLSYQELDSTVRSITDLKLLASLQALVSDLMRLQIEQLPLEQTGLVTANPNAALIEVIEDERNRINSPSQWQAVLKAFDIAEGELINLYNGKKPSFEFQLRLSKLLRLEIEELQRLIGIQQLDGEISSPSSDDEGSNGHERNGDGLARAA